MELRTKLKNIADRANGKVRRVTAACVLIVLALAMFFGAMFMPFQYYSNKSVLHVVHIDDGSGEEESRTVTQTERVHQSLFKVFGAAATLGDASKLHAAATGFIDDYAGYEKARMRLNELREEYQKIHNATMREAMSRGVSVDSAEFTRMLADNLSGMNLIALDMLETAFTSDNSGAYEAQFGGIVLALLVALIDIMIMIAAVIAVIFGAVMLVSMQYKAPPRVFMTVFTVMTAVGLTLCLFNPIIPPAAGPLALAAIAVSVFYLFGLARAVTGELSNRILVRNAVVGAVVPAAMLCLAAMPSFTLYVNGLGGRYLFYPGTVGTVCYSRIEAVMAIGLKISVGTVVLSYILGGFIAAFSILCSVKALRRLYRRDGLGNDGMFSAAALITGALAIAFMIAVAVTSAQAQARGEAVKYISGASWYVAAIVNVLAAAYIIIDNVLKKKSDTESEKLGATEQDERTDSEASGGLENNNETEKTDCSESIGGAITETTKE